MLSTIQKLLLAFITLIIGLVLVGSIAVSSNGLTTMTSVTDEEGTMTAAGGPPQWDGTSINESYEYTITNAPTSWKVLDCPITNFAITNSSGTAWTVTTDYVFTASTGTYTLVDTDVTNQTSQTDNQTLVSYSYCGDDFLNSTWQRSIMNLIPGFFALALLIFSVGMFFSVAKDAGII